MSEKISRLEEGAKEQYYNETGMTHGSEKLDEYDPTCMSQQSAVDPETTFQGTKRGLNARHIQMISLGGAIGTGLFLSSGQNIATAGPGGALIAYCVIGFMVYCIMTCLGEMATFMPVSGSFNHYATRFIDPSLGFALGWNYCKSLIPFFFSFVTELSAAATIINWWKPVMPDAAWSAIFLVLIIAINLVGVRIYGELEYWFALIKILITIVFIIIAICVSTGGLGGEVIGFKYWHDPGAFVGGGVGTVSVLLTAGFSFQGTEIVGITAGEAKNPTKTVPRAIRNTFWRIVFFYIVTMFLLGITLPNDDPNLENSDDSAGTAAFTLVFQKAGIDAGAHVINAIILTSVLSAANSALYTCSRTLLGLAHDGNGPAFLSRTNRYGSPYWAVIISSIIGFACVFASIYSASEAFNWFLSITAVSGFISWWGIAFVHLRFRRAYKRQGRLLEDLPYKAFLYPYSAIFACVLCILIILGQGYTAFTPEFDGVLFVTNYIGIVPAILCYVIYKLVRRTRVVPLDEVDFDTGRVSRFEMEQEEAEERNLPWYRKVFNVIA
ncbi:amino acid permease/ SLC12A domain-containing protein [Zychaea mexicana]|uniref:amino acid permease/ SLC12A domain-containing protein n=1 Tax=Zychaea mexicana TaxID=64656 RepID=UPI0022FEE96F|nr:amino acid permease/ SLC12A domain-containing protein [Zychaea mexicana]KAI9494930.1 amino acid permease/ SLC12A domain-containing protein [Zychaea mexicana]